MNRFVRLRTIFFATAMMGASPLLTMGQTPVAGPASSAAQMPAGIIQSLSSVADQPASHTGFVFDRSMLQMARAMMQSDDPAVRHAALSISSIAFDNYRYPQPATYVPEAMSSISAAYEAAGWKHLVNGHDKYTESGMHRGNATDLWLHFTGSDVDGVTVLTRGSRDMNVVQVACDLRPLDLLKLGGHFGIPKIDPDAVMVPAPASH